MTKKGTKWHKKRLKKAREYAERKTGRYMK